MNRNVESHFALNPTYLDMSRSKFDRSHSVKFTFNVGELIPFYCDEVLPGDTFQIKTSKVVRLQTMLTPMMDNLYLDTYYFFVPNRLTWTHWRELMGENTESAWIPATEYQVPQLVAPEGGFDVCSVADYMGIPPKVENLSVSNLPFRAYALICDEWFRDQNLLDPLIIYKGDAVTAGISRSNSNYRNGAARGGLPFRVAKYHDYFTSCLPSPQKGDDVRLPTSALGVYPVVGNGRALGLTDGTSAAGLGDDGVSGSYFTATTANFGKSVGTSNSGSRTGEKKVLGVVTEQQVGTDYGASGLVALASGGFGATINELRFAFQLQKLYEKDARGGTRYIEVIKSHFGVTSPDARQQRPEYLGGNRLPINVNQIVQQSESGTTPQGTPVGLSLTTDNHGDFIKSFTEHGFVIGVCVARYDHTYQQGIERMFSRKSRFDFYWPVFANIGEQAVRNKEIYAQGNSQDDEVFGYQEAWSEYRYKPNRVAGEMRSIASMPLDNWHLADNYNTLPTLSSSWITEDRSNVDRVLAVTSAVSNQIFADFYISGKVTRPMPMYSIPGLIDHH